MQKRCVWAMLCMAVLLLMPGLLLAQGGNTAADGIKSMQSVLDKLYEQLIPLCGKLTGVGQGLAAFGTTFYIGSRIWKHIANAEPVDFYPLFRPFVIGFIIINFTLFNDFLRFFLKPTVDGTKSLVENSDKAVADLLKRKEDAIKETPSWLMYVGPEGKGNYNQWYEFYVGKKSEGWVDHLENGVKFALSKASYNFRNSIKEFMSIVLQIFFQAAALCINTIRIFYMIILAIMGPLALGLSVFDGFQHILTTWLARYINVFLWLPVANIFGAVIGKIQENMLEIDIAQVQQHGDTFFTTSDAAYLVFMIIGCVGYFTVPSVTNYIINPGHGSNFLYKVSNFSRGAVGFTTGMLPRPFGR